MANTDWMKCKIENSGFHRERKFEVELPTGDRAVGTAFIDYLRDAAMHELGESSPPYGQTMQGFVQYRIIRKSDNDIVLEFPSSDVFHVPASALEGAALR